MPSAGGSALYGVCTSLTSSTISRLDCFLVVDHHQLVRMPPQAA